MKLFVRSLCLAAILLTQAQAQAQEQESVNFKFFFKLTERKDYATLDDLSASLLNDPYVQVEIGIKKSQIAMLPLRERTTKFFTVMGVASTQSAETTEEGTAAATQALKSFQDPTGLTLKDLNRNQRDKLEKVALSERPMEALLTKEVNFALRLSPEQQKRLNIIRDEYWTRCSKIEEKHTDTKAYLKLMKSYGDKNSDDLSGAQKMTLVKDLMDKMSVIIAKIATEIEQPVAQALKESNARALKVLTSAQTTQFRRLQSR